MGGICGLVIGALVSIPAGGIGAIPGGIAGGFAGGALIGGVGGAAVIDYHNLTTWQASGEQIAIMRAEQTVLQSTPSPRAFCM